MREFKSDNRLARIEDTIRARQYSIQVVIENIHDPHNVSAILRTCDAVGVPQISLVYTIEEFPKLSRISSSSALKWVERDKYKSIDECYAELRARGFKILVSRIDKGSTNIYDTDLTDKIALVFGNENRGVSQEALSKADGSFYIPMHGMVQSLNVSVAAAVVLYEASRQRSIKGCYSRSDLSEEGIQKKIDEWCRK